MNKWTRTTGLCLFGLIINHEITFSTEPSGNLSDALTTEACYTGDFINNLRGGIKTGSCYLGMAGMKLDFDLSKTILGKGGRFGLHAASTHGGSPSLMLLGDRQVASNIEAGNHSFLMEFWYQQSIGKFGFTVGLQDLNSEFASSCHASAYLNSSFGIIPVITSNISAPVFPLTSPGLTLKWNIGRKSTWINAVYDGSPADFDYNPYNLNWKFRPGDGILLISEFQYATEVFRQPGSYKLGLCSHNHLVDKLFEHRIPDSLDNHFSGIYLYADQYILKTGKKGLAFFAQLAYSPSPEAVNDFYLGTGINVYGLSDRREEDVLGLAFAGQKLRNRDRGEKVIEMSYSMHFHRRISLQPDIQYIINPSGSDRELGNSLSLNLRFFIRFN